MRQTGKSDHELTLARALDRLSGVGWFSTRSDATRARLGALARLRTFEAGATVYSVGDEPNGLFGLVEGAFDISIPRADGHDFTIHKAEPGFWVGDLALMSSGRRLISVHSATASTAVHIGASELLTLVQTEPQMMHDFYALTYENFATTFFLLANISIASSESRVALRLLMHLEQMPDPEGWVHLSQADLAEMIALSQPTLQRALKRLQDMGCVQPGCGRVRVVDRVKLLSLCGENKVLSQGLGDMDRVGRNA